MAYQIVSNVQKMARNNSPYWSVQFVGDNGEVLTATTFDPNVGRLLPQQGFVDMQIQFDTNGRRRIASVNTMAHVQDQAQLGQTTQAPVPYNAAPVNAQPMQNRPIDPTRQSIHRCNAMNNAVSWFTGRDVAMADVIALADGIYEWLNSGSGEWSVYFDADRQLPPEPAEETVNDTAA